jgi:methylenetetrahydrofolate reductase (NADPH)
MAIRDLFGKNKKLFSFEFFPPKTPEGEEKLYETVRELKQLNPDFVSVTYGAMGNTRGKTLEIVSKIQNQIGIEAMMHLTCVSHSQTQLKEILSDIKSQGVQNIMALRGDPPKGTEKFVAPLDGFQHGSELIAFIKKSDFGFCIGGAAYPEGHVESLPRGEDFKFSKLKQDQGADFLVTQLFFENRHYFEYVEKVRNVGVTVPILPGVMPVTNLSQIQRFTQMMGCEFPEIFLNKLQAVESDPLAVEAVGVEYAVKQCQELLKRGAPGIHLYTLNQSKATQKIMKALRHE